MNKEEALRCTWKCIGCGWTGTMSDLDDDDAGSVCPQCGKRGDWELAALPDQHGPKRAGRTNS